MMSNVVEINSIPHKGNKPIATGNIGSENATAVDNSGTIMVTMISQTLRDPNHPGQIFIHEMLPQTNYQLYRRAKAKAIGLFIIKFGLVGVGYMPRNLAVLLRYLFLPTLIWQSSTDILYKPNLQFYW